MKTLTHDYVADLRKQFPALSRRENDRQVVFFDGPAGTQVPSSVAKAMTDYLLGCNANHGGCFGTSIESDEWLDKAYEAFADFVGASDPDEIIFGQNMTSLTFAFSRALARTWGPGDEIVVTRLDHDANVAPWVLAAEEAGATVKRVGFRPGDCTLDMDELRLAITDRTRLVAVGCASNATGGLNPVRDVADLAHAVGALVYLDAVHYGPHGLIDVVEWDCDFVAFSAYKFFGPHLGTLWGRRELLENLDACKVRPSSNEIPGKWMTGTQSHESIVGGMAAIDYLAQMGRPLDGDEKLGRRDALKLAFQGIREYEQRLSRRLLEGLSKIEGVRIYGIEDASRLEDRFPTFSITADSIPTSQLAKRLAQDGIYVWSGNYYALEFTEQLGLEPEGMVRIGLVHYNTETEVDRLLESLQSIVVGDFQQA